jgi:hypothetical protein
VRPDVTVIVVPRRRASVEYSASFEADIEDLERVVVALVEADEGADSDAVHRDYLVVLDHVINTYPVPAAAVRSHAERVAAIHDNNDPGTASKRIATQHEVFMDEVCDDYDPVF